MPHLLSYFHHVVDRRIILGNQRTRALGYLEYHSLRHSDSHNCWSYLMRKLRTISRRSMADLTFQSIVQSISVQVLEPPGHMTTLSVPAISTERERTFSSTKKLLSPHRFCIKEGLMEASECLKAWWGCGSIDFRHALHPYLLIGKSSDYRYRSAYSRVVVGTPFGYG